MIHSFPLYLATLAVKIKHLPCPGTLLKTISGDWWLFECPKHPSLQLVDQLTEMKASEQIKNFRYIADSERPVLLVEA